MSPLLSLLLLHQWLNVPDALRILINAPVAAEEAHSSHRQDSLGGPCLRVLVRLINQLLSLDVRRKVIRDEVVVSVLDDAVEECAE